MTVARVSWESAEVLTTPGVPALRVTQEAVHVIATAPPPPVRVSRVAVDVLISTAEFAPAVQESIEETLTLTATPTATLRASAAVSEALSLGDGYAGSVVTPPPYAELVSALSLGVSLSPRVTTRVSVSEGVALTAALAAGRRSFAELLETLAPDAALSPTVRWNIDPLASAWYEFDYEVNFVAFEYGPRGVNFEYPPREAAFEYPPLQNHHDVMDGH